MMMPPLMAKLLCNDSDFTTRETYECLDVSIKRRCHHFTKEKLTSRRNVIVFKPEKTIERSWIMQAMADVIETGKVDELTRQSNQIGSNVEISISQTS